MKVHATLGVALLTVALAIGQPSVACGDDTDPLAAARKFVERIEAQAQPPPAERLVALRTVAAHDDAESLSLALRIVSGMDKGAASSRSLIRTYERVLRSALDRRWKPRTLVDAWPDLPGPLRRVTCLVLVGRRRRTELSLCMDLVEEGPADLPALVDTLRRASPVVACQLPLVRFLRPFARHEDPAVRVAVARSLVASADDDACPVLIRMLEDADPSVRKAAHGSLRTLTKARNGPEAKAWRSWHEAEGEWERDSEVVARLDSDSAVEVARALRQLGERRLIALRRRDVIADLVGHEVPGVRLLACAMLRRLAVGGAAPQLVDALGDDDASVRDAAWKTLKQLSGEGLPLDRRAWKAAHRRWRS